MKFKMGTAEKEKQIVDKFQLGMVSQKAVLNLKQYGKIRVADILDMRLIDDLPNKSSNTFDINDLLGSNFQVKNIKDYFN